MEAFISSFPLRSTLPRTTLTSRCSRAKRVGVRASASRDAEPASQRAIFTRLIRPDVPVLVRGMSCLLFATAANLVTPALFGATFDAAQMHDVAKLAKVSLTLGGLYSVEAVFVFFELWTFNVAGERLLARLRSQVYQKLVDRDIPEQDRTQVGGLVSRVSGDTLALRNLMTVDAPSLFRSLATIVGSFVGCFLTSMRLAMVIAFLCPVSAFLIAFIGSKLKKLAKESSDVQADAAGLIDESLTGIRVVHSFNLQDRMKALYAKPVNKMLTIGEKSGVLTGAMSSLSRFATTLTTLFVLWGGGQLVINNVLSVGKVMSFTIFSFRLGGSFSQMTSLVGRMMQSFGSTERIFSLLAPEQEGTRTTRTRLENFTGNIKLQNVSFKYPDTEVFAVRNITLELTAGSSVALIGRSGSGKTSLLGLIRQFYEPQEGSILFDGISSRTADATSIREKVAVVEQNPFLFTGTIMENIRNGNLACSTDDVLSAGRNAGCDDFVLSLPDGYETKIRPKGQGLSGGQLQRIAIARALVRNPKVLLLDEPTSALDRENEDFVNESLRNIIRTGEMTIVLIAHKLDPATIELFDKIVVLQGGEVIQRGPHSTLAQDPSGYYARLLRL